MSSPESGSKSALKNADKGAQSEWFATVTLPTADCHTPPPCGGAFEGYEDYELRVQGETRLGRVCRILRDQTTVPTELRVKCPFDPTGVSGTFAGTAEFTYVQGGLCISLSRTQEETNCPLTAVTSIVVDEVE